MTNRNVRIARLLAFLMGAASLAGQVSWSRVASAVVGGTLPAWAITLSAAMIGLAAGAMLAGVGRARLRGTILAAAVSLAALPWLILQVGRLEGLPGVRAALTAALLAIGHAPFGALLPCLAAWRGVPEERLARGAGDLLAWSALGAAMGAWGASEVLAPRLALDHLGVLLGGATALCSALPGNSRSREAVAAVPAAGGAPQRSRILVAFAMGCLGLVTEVLWLRILGYAWEASASTFALVTASSVAGLSLGSWGASRIAGPGRAGVLVGLGCSAAAVAGAAVLASEAHRATGAVERIGMALLLVGAPSVCFGATFVFLLEGVGERTPGRSLGLLCGANSAGSAAGPMLFWASAPTAAWPPQVLLFVACGYSGLLAVACGRSWRGRSTALLLTAALGLGAGTLAPAAPDVTPYASGGEGETTTLPFVRAGLDSTVAVTRDTRSGVDVLWIDRSLQGDTSALGRRIPRVLGRLPGELLGRPARRALAIGLGTGMTLAGIVDQGAREVHVAELSRGVIEATRTILADANERVLERKEVRVFFADGRTMLSDAEASYDLIVTDMVFPSAVGAANLFSREFYALSRRRLASDGVFVHWIPCSQLSPEDLASVLAGFLEAFPDGSAWIGFMGPRRLILGLAAGSICGSLPESTSSRLALRSDGLRDWAAGAVPIRDADPRVEQRSRPRPDGAYGIENVRALMARTGRSGWTAFAEAELAELSADEAPPGSAERRDLRDQAFRSYRDAARGGLVDAEFFLQNLEFERHLELARAASDRRDSRGLLASLEKAAACPLHGVGNLYLADALAARGRLEEALEQLEKAVAKSPRSEDARFRLRELSRWIGPRRG